MPDAACAFYPDAMADICGVLSAATRRDLLARLLRDGELSVGALVEQTELSQPTVSKHLRVLRDQGLVVVREEAQHRYYRLDAAPLAEVADWLAAFRPAEPAARRQAASDAAPIIAWSGAGAGEQLGRAAATTVHQALAVLQALRDATEETRERIANAAEMVKQVLPVNAGEQ